MEYILMLVAIIFAAINSAALKQFKNKTFRTPGDVFFFNGGVSIIWIFVMGIWFTLEGGGFSAEAALYGIVYALILCLFLYLKTQALATGPVALTTIISSAAFLIPTLYGAVFWSETIRPAQYAGIALILLSLFMCVNPKKSTEKLTPKWFVYYIAFFFVGGVLGIFYKIFGASSASGNINFMMLCASVFSSIFFFAFGLSINGIKKAQPPKLHPAALPYVLLSGIAGCVYIRLNISLAALIPSAIFFPVSNGALVLISTALGFTLFKEKLTKLQLYGIFLGCIAIAVTGCGDALIAYLFQ